MFVKRSLFSGTLPCKFTLASPSSQHGLNSETTRLCLGSSASLPEPWSENSLQAVGLLNPRARLVYFLFLKNHCPALPVVQCGETVVWDILSFTELRQEDKSSPSTLILKKIYTRINIFKQVLSPKLPYTDRLNVYINI